MRRLNDSMTLDFTTHNPLTGEVSDADAIPACEVFEEDNDISILTPTAAKRSGKTGNYRVTFVLDAAGGFEIGKSYSVIATAVVGGKTAKARIASFNIDPPSVAPERPRASFSV